MSRAVLSLGSNLGDRLAYLQLAVEGLRDSLLAVSPVYETAPWGVRDQPEFLNAVCIVDDQGRDHWQWLRRAQELERAAERERERRWGPRTLDVDVVSVDAIRCREPELMLPHPGTADRATVLIPWLDIEPDAELPGHGTVAGLLDAVPAAERAGIRRRNDLELRW